MRDPYATVSLTCAQVQEALGELNRHYCGEALRKEPTTRELLVWYIDHTCPIRPITYTVMGLTPQEFYQPLKRTGSD